ncbi:MAG: hypothetical protein AB1545_11140 [Thermodesulfobacteriota bacterium]|jgi:hypothetical protein
MRKYIFLICLIILLGISVRSFAGEAASTQAVLHSGQASAHSAQAVFSGLIASGQVASAVSATPLALSATAGVVSGEAAKVLMDAATAPIGTPLPVTEETYTSAGPPPDQALKVEEKKL